MIFPKFYCGECLKCKNGEQNLCGKAEFIGVFSRNGAMKERIAIGERYLILVDSKLEDIELALTEPLSVANYAVMKIIEMGIPRYANLLVVGAGTIVLFILQILKVHGYNNVFVIDLNDKRLDIVKNLGGIPLNSKTTDCR